MAGDGDSGKNGDDFPELPDISGKLDEIAATGLNFLKGLGLGPDNSLVAGLSSGISKLSETIAEAEAQAREDLARAKEAASSGSIEAELNAAWERMQERLGEIQRQMGEQAPEARPSFPFSEVFGPAFGDKLHSTFAELFSRNAPAKERPEDVLSDLARLRISYEAVELRGALKRSQARAIAEAAQEGLSQAAIMLGRVRTVRRLLDLDAPIVTVEYEISGEAASMTAGMLAMVGFSSGALPDIGKVRAKVELG